MINFPENMTELPEDIHELLEDGSTRFDKLNKSSNHWYDDASKNQPYKFTWITLDVSNRHLAADGTTGLHYEDNQDFRDGLKNYIDVCFSDDMINHFREGRLIDMKIVIGPHRPSGDDLNEDLGDDFVPNIGLNSK